MSYEIFTDMSIDAEEEFLRTHPIHYIPMEYMLGDTEKRCTAPESFEDLHKYYDELRKEVPTKTSQITPFHYFQNFEPLVQEGKEILYLSLSSGLSNTYDSACLAAQQLKEDYPDAKIEVVDTLGATGGMGLLMEKAFENQEKGMSLTENANWLRESAKKLNYHFKVADLMYLKRGGRISSTSAVLGTALNIKPVLCITSNGKLETMAKKRGDRLAHKFMLDQFASNFDESYGDTVYLCCSDCMNILDEMEKQLLEMNPNLKIKKTMLSPIIGAHTGPDMVAIIYFGKERL